MYRQRERKVSLDEISLPCERITAMSLRTSAHQLMYFTHQELDIHAPRVTIDIYYQCRYKMALKSSQLLSDLKLLADYDLTEIGERGVTLSGGQKQRVSIARAVYADADVVILDDPLSAVDAHVGKALFEKCLRGALKDKTVILVTNALHFVHNADQLVWLYGGEVRQAGTYEEVRRLSLPLLACLVLYELSEI